MALGPEFEQKWFQRFDTSKQDVYSICRTVWSQKYHSHSNNATPNFVAHLSASSRDNFDFNELNSKLQEKQTDNITQNFQPLVQSPTPEHEACDVELNGKTYSFKVSHALADSSSEGDSDDGDDNSDDSYDHPIPEDLALKIAR